jgi:hypothetical protein
MPNGFFPIQGSFIIPVSFEEMTVLVVNPVLWRPHRGLKSNFSKLTMSLKVTDQGRLTEGEGSVQLTSLY